MEPERKIEKWLRAYAKKRKGQAGEPFDLHPATRRLLHGEIARNTPEKDDKDDETSSLWEVFRRDWAFLLGFALCIFFVATVFFHSLTTSKKAMLTASKSTRQQLGAVQEDKSKFPETLSEMATNGIGKLPANRSVPENALADNKDFYRLTNSAMPGTLAMNNSPAAPPAETTQRETPMPSDSLAAPQPEQPPPPAPTAGASPAVAPPPMEASIPSAMQPQTGLPEASTLSGETQTFAASSRIAPQPQNLFKNKAQTVPVLANFQLQQNGNTIRIVDQDGSVYEGSLYRGTPGVATATLRPSTQGRESPIIRDQVHTAPEAAFDFPSEKNTNAVTSMPGNIPPGNAPQAQTRSKQNYFFMVHGMNRTLNQNVVFTGTFKANLATVENLNHSPQPNNAQTDSSGPVGGYGGGASAGNGQIQWAVKNQFTQFSWSNLNIKGTAIINRTNRIPINARPVTSTNN